MPRVNRVRTQHALQPGAGGDTGQGGGRSRGPSGPLTEGKCVFASNI